MNIIQWTKCPPTAGLRKFVYLANENPSISRRIICQELLKDYVSLNNEDEMLFYTIQPISPIFPPVCGTTIYCGGCHLYKL